MHIKVVGAGALGLLFAGKMAEVCDVEVITRTVIQSNQLNSEGIHLIEEDQETVSAIKAFQVTTKQPSPAIKRDDWVFLMMKQKDITNDLLTQLRSYISEQTRVLCFQNGVGHAEKVSAFFPRSRVYVAVTTEAALKISDTRVEHTGKGITYLGMVEQEKQAESFDQQEILLQSVLLKAGFEVYLSKKMISLIWNKLVLNAIINPLTAILNIQNGQLLGSPHLMQLMQTLLDEGVLATRLAGIELSENLWEQLLEVCERTAFNRSSMLQDIQQGRKTEIDWINGALMKAAERCDQYLPSHTMLYQMIKHIESR